MGVTLDVSKSKTFILVNQTCFEIKNPKPNLIWLNVYGRDFSTVRSWRNAQTLAAKGRLIRCTVLGSTPKRAAIFRPRCVQATLERQGFVFLIRALSGAANAISPKSRT